MGRQALTEEELLSPTKYKIDHGTMTLHPEKSTPTMQITLAGSPPVFLREGGFYAQDGTEYNFDNFPGGEDAFLEHLRKTANPAILAMHGLGGETQEANGQATQTKATEMVRKAEPHPNLKNFAPPNRALAEDPDLVLETLGDRDMDIGSIAEVAGIPTDRVRMAIDVLGNQIERVGEGKRGSPYLYRKAMPAE